MFLRCFGELLSKRQESSVRTDKNLEIFYGPKQVNRIRQIVSNYIATVPKPVREILDKDILDDASCCPDEIELLVNDLIDESR